MLSVASYCAHALCLIGRVDKINVHLFGRNSENRKTELDDMLIFKAVLDKRRHDIAEINLCEISCNIHCELFTGNIDLCALDAEKVTI